MTPTDVMTAARDLYNATGDTFFTDTQLMNWMWQACNVFAKECNLIENVFSLSTIVGTQTYSYPTHIIALKRVTYQGHKLKRLTFRQDDAVTLSNQASIQSGLPTYYSDFNYTLYLRPIPNDVQTLQIFGYSMAAQITALTTLEIPELFHMDLVNPMLRNMYAKDQNPQMATYYDNLWKQNVSDAKRWKKKQMRSDGFSTVQDEETLPVTIMGVI